MSSRTAEELRRADATRTLISQGIKRIIDEVNKATDLSIDHENLPKRALRINYFAQD